MQLYGTHADMATLDAHVASGIINRRPHPTETDVFIYNYSPVAQYDRAWDDHVLQARGLVVRADGLILGRPMPKFFNFEEMENAGFALPWDKPFAVTSKADGSMFLVSKHYSATRGSFESTQAEWGREILRESNAKLDPNITYIFELIHPENRIVVDYHGERKLILLAMLETATGHELPLDDTLGFELIKTHEVPHGETPAQSLAALNTPNEEGFVVRFENGTRVKIKFEDYKRLHKIVTGVSTKSIYEMLRIGASFNEMLELVPDEFNEFVKNTISELTSKYKALEDKGLELYNAVKGLPTRKEQAMYINAQKTDVGFIAYKSLDGKSYTDGIWKLCEPIYRQPFSSRENI